MFRDKDTSSRRVNAFGAQCRISYPWPSLSFWSLGRDSGPENNIHFTHVLRPLSFGVSFSVFTSLVTKYNKYTNM
jgi:hypothetical protein